MPRKTKQLAVRDEFLILTNGKRTEKNYFEAVRSNYKSIFKISVKFMNDDPVALVDHAIGMKNARNRVWCVFDKDEFPTDSVEPAIKTAKENGIGIAFSNVAFEVWLIDHFEKCHTEKTAEKLIADFDRILRAKGYNKGYAIQVVFIFGLIEIPDVNSHLEKLIWTWMLFLCFFEPCFMVCNQF